MPIINPSRPAPFLNEWDRYVVPDPFDSATETGEAEPFLELAHVAHVHHAIGIVQEGKIKPGLVFDASKLNTTRTLVCWLSPKEWEAYRYGNVRFVFNWADLVQDSAVLFYWVEAITEYNPHAVRVLVTLTNHDANRLITRFDPTQRTMPIWRRASDGSWFWNKRFTVELMIEWEILLSLCKRIEFVEHQQNQCCIDWRNCPDRGVSPSVGGSRFIAALITQGLQVPVETLTILEGQTRQGSPHLRIGCSPFREFVDMARCEGFLTAQHPVAQSAVKGIFAAMARRDSRDAANLASLFSTQTELRSAFRSALRENFGIETNP